MEDPTPYDSGGLRAGAAIDRALRDRALRVPFSVCPRPDHIRLALRRSGFSVERLAVLLGVNPARVHRWTRGTASPKGAERALLLLALLEPDALRRLDTF